MSTAGDLRPTNADLECVPDNGTRYELIDGALYLSAPPTFTHQTKFVNIAFAFLQHLRLHPIGRIAPGVGVIPDLVIATRERMSEALVAERFRVGVEATINNHNVFAKPESGTKNAAETLAIPIVQTINRLANWPRERSGTKGSTLSTRRTNTYIGQHYYSDNPCLRSRSVD
jgi:hypothetical protein